MPATPEDLFARFAQLGIDLRLHHHAPAFTVEEGNAAWAGIPGMHCKNLFLKDSKGRLWLVVAPADMRVDLKALPARIGSARLSFGSAALLEEVLGIPPGSVTPFALINDGDRRVGCVLDAGMMAQPLVNYHPLRNDMTVTVTPDELRLFLASTGHVPAVVAL